jgi:toxin ParE1/3/4
VKYSLHPDAEKELIDAFNFYKERAGDALARAFLAEFERVAELVAANPLYGTSLSGEHRCYPLRRFPYSLVYHVISEEVRVLVVGHQHRRPGYWRNRT